MKKLETLKDFEEVLKNGTKAKLVYCSYLDDELYQTFVKDAEYNLSNSKDYSVVNGGCYDIYQINDTDILWIRKSSEDVTIYRLIKKENE